MAGSRNVLVIGLDPALIDFSQPGYAPGMDAAKVRAGLRASEDELTRLGYSVHMCLTDFGETEVYHLGGFELGGRDWQAESGSVGALTWDDGAGKFTFLDLDWLRTFTRHNWKWR